MEVHNVYLGVLDHLDAAGVRYAVLHGWESLAKGDVSDIDLIVSFHDLSRVESALRECYRILNVFQYEAASFGFVLSPREGDPSSTLVADFSTDYRWRGRIFFTDEELLQSRQRWLGYWVAGPAQEFAYLLVKKIYEKGTIPAQQRTRIEQLAQCLGPEAEGSVFRLFGRLRGKRLIDWIRHQRWTQIEAHVPELRQCLRRQILKRDYLNPLRYWKAEIGRVWTRWCHPSGLSVVVAGVHGKEEMTLVRGLQSIPHAFRRIVTLETAPPPNGRSSQASSLRRVHQLLRSALTSQIRLRMLVVRSALVILKGNNCDLLGNGNRKNTLSRLIRYLIPKADLVFTIGAPGSPLSSQEQGSVRELTKGTHQPLGRQQVVVLNHRLPEEQFSRDAREALADFLCRRYAAYRHLWFPGQTFAAHIK